AFAPDLLEKLVPALVTYCRAALATCLRNGHAALAALLAFAHRNPLSRGTAVCPATAVPYALIRQALGYRSAGLPSGTLLKQLDVDLAWRHHVSDSPWFDPLSVCELVSAGGSSIQALKRSPRL